MTTQSDSIVELAKAFIAAQGELEPVIKDKTARTEKFSYDYVGLDTVMPAALKVLNKHGLGVVQSVGNGAHDGSTTLTTMLIHASGEWIADTQPLLLVRPDPQGQGSAITYARRYGLMAMIGMVAEEDDDGAAASQPPPAQQYADSGRQMAQEYAQPPQGAPVASGGQPRGPMTQAKYMERSQYKGTCYDCGSAYEAGDPIYFQKVDGKSRCWHEQCYQQGE
jgi:hypothetical protein